MLKPAQVADGGQQRAYFSGIDADQPARHGRQEHSLVWRVFTIAMKRSFAVLAALFLLLRPLCDVLAADPAHGERAADAYAVAEHTTGSADRLGENTHCCTAIEDGAYAKPAEATAVRAVGDSELAFAAPAWTAAGYAPDQNVDARHRPGVLLARTSYYARSARIRR